MNRVMSKERQHALAFGESFGHTTLGNMTSGYPRAARMDVAVIAFWSLERREGMAPWETCEADRRMYDNELECGHE